MLLCTYDTIMNEKMCTLYVILYLSPSIQGKTKYTCALKQLMICTYDMMWSLFHYCPIELDISCILYM